MLCPLSRVMRTFSGQPEGLRFTRAISRLRSVRARRRIGTSAFAWLVATTWQKFRPAAGRRLPADMVPAEACAAGRAPSAFPVRHTDADNRRGVVGVGNFPINVAPTVARARGGDGYYRPKSGKVNPLLRQVFCRGLPGVREARLVSMGRSPVFKSTEGEQNRMIAADC